MIVCDVLEKNNSFYRLPVEVTKNSREIAEKSYFFASQNYKSNIQILTVNFDNQIMVILQI